MRSTPKRSTRKWLTSLGGKFVLLVAGILAITMGASAVINYRSHTQEFLQHLTAKGKLLGNFIARISPEAILSYDFVTLDDYIRDVTREPDLVYAVIVSPDHTSMTSYLDEQDRYIADAIKTLGTNHVMAVIAQVNRKRDIIPLNFPIMFDSDKLGSVTIGLTRRHIDQLATRELLTQLLGNSFIILFLGFCIYIVFRHNALRPIYQLIKGSERIAHGALEQEVPVYSSDELGTLTESFNNMIEKLKATGAEKDQAMLALRELNTTLESRVVERTHELAALNVQLEHLALHDALTGLPNRSLLQDRLEHGISIAKRENKPLAVMMLDLDRFKEVNDTLGHHAGDQLLQEVGRRLRDLLRNSDTVGRLGGDEFLIILPGVGIENSILVAEKVKSALEAPFVLEHTSFSIAASIGIAVYPAHGDDSTTLLKRADVAMYVAKQDRRGHFVYEPSQDTHTPNGLALMGELRNAIENNELELYYQPQLNLLDGHIVGVEALARWRHAEKGFIPPDEFIPLMEQTGLIKPFALWVLDTALQQWAQWADAGMRLTMAVNLSMRNLQDPQLPSQLSALLKKWHTRRESLVVEITESAVMSDAASVMDILRKLNSMGLQLSIDDFGSGYSSLNYLKRLPVNEVKIDRSFITDMATDKDDAVIVRSTIELAHNLGLHVVAEGVENAETLATLKALGCDFAQGYHICRPLPAEEITRFLSGSALAGNRGVRSVG